jgi:hypothetical protein
LCRSIPGFGCKAAEQAKNEARRLGGLIASGENPAQIRSHERSVPTIALEGDWPYLWIDATHVRFFGAVSKVEPRAGAAIERSI